MAWGRPWRPNCLCLIRGTRESLLWQTHLRWVRDSKEVRLAFGCRSIWAKTWSSALVLLDKRDQKVSPLMHMIWGERQQGVQLWGLDMESAWGKILEMVLDVFDRRAQRVPHTEVALEVEQERAGR